MLLVVGSLKTLWNVVEQHVVVHAAVQAGHSDLVRGDHTENGLVGKHELDEEGK